MRLMRTRARLRTQALRTQARPPGAHGGLAAHHNHEPDQG
jgi:hypothetical protein